MRCACKFVRHQVDLLIDLKKVRLQVSIETLYSRQDGLNSDIRLAGEVNAPFAVAFFNQGLVRPPYHEGTFTADGEPMNNGFVMC